MDKSFNIQEYMTEGVERIVADALRATFRIRKRAHIC